MHPLWSCSCYLPIFFIRALVLLVAPIIDWVQRIDCSPGLKNSVFIDILDFQIRVGFDEFGELGRLATCNWLSEDFTPTIPDSGLSGPIDILDFEGIPLEISTRVHTNFSSCGQLINWTEWVNISTSFELMCLGPRSLNIIVIERIRHFVDVFCAIRHGLNIR